MSLKNKEINDHSKTINTKKNLILNSDLFNPKSLRMFQKNNKNKVIISKDILKTLINNNNLTSRNYNLLKYPNISLSSQKKQNKQKLNKKFFTEKESDLTKNNQFRKKEKININTNDINNCNNDDDQIDNNYNNSNNGRIIGKDKSKDLIKIKVYDTNLALINIEKRSRDKLNLYNITLKKYYIKIINDILDDKDKHIVSLFKNYLICNEPNDYLKRYYFLNETEYRLNPIAYYYNYYTYCFPNYYCNLEIIKILLKNVKKKIKYLEEKDSYDNKRYTRRTQNNCISNVFDEKYNNNRYENNNKEKEFTPLIESFDFHKESQNQLYSINKRSISLSSTIQYDIEYEDNNLSNVNKKQNNNSNDNNNINDLFDINLTPIKNNIIKKDFNNHINNNNNKKEKEKIDNENYNYEQSLRTKNILDNELVNEQNKSGNKKINIKFSKYKLGQVYLNLKNKNIHTYFKTDYNDVNDVSTKKNTKNKELNNINKRMKFNSFLNKNNNTKDSSIIKQNKINIKKIKLNHKIKNIFHNCFTQRTKLLNITNKTNNNNQMFNSENSLIIFPKKNFLINNRIKNYSNFDIIRNNNNIKCNLNYIFFDNNKYSRLLTSNERKKHFSSKKIIGFSQKFHSLSINKKGLLKLSENSKINVILKNKRHIYSSNSNNSSLSKTRRQTSQKTNQKHKKGKSDILLLKKRNIILLNLKTTKNLRKKTIYNNNNRKISSLKTVKYIQNLIDIFKNSNKNQFYEENYRNKTYLNDNKTNYRNKLTLYKTKRKCKSNSPDISNKEKRNIKINKHCPNLKVINSLFGVSKKKLSAINDNIFNYNNNYIVNNDNNSKYNIFDNSITKKIVNKNKHKMEKINNYYIKSYNPGMTSIYNINLNLNLNTQHDTSKTDTKNNNSINIIYSKNKLKGKNRIKSSKLIEIKKKNKY